MRALFLQTVVSASSSAISEVAARFSIAKQSKVIGTCSNSTGSGHGEPAVWRPTPRSFDVGVSDAPSVRSSIAIKHLLTVVHGLPREHARQRVLSRLHAPDRAGRRSLIGSTLA